MSKRKREEDGTKKKKKEEAYIRIDGKQHYFGMFGTPKEAAEAYHLAFLDQVPKNYKPMKKKLLSTNTTGFRGVCKMRTKMRNRFRANINIDGKQQALGTFDTPKEAAEAYDQAVLQAGYPTSKLNFLDQVPKNYQPKKKKLLFLSTFFSTY